MNANFPSSELVQGSFTVFRAVYTQPQSKHNRSGLTLTLKNHMNFSQHCDFSSTFSNPSQNSPNYPAFQKSGTHASETTPIGATFWQTNLGSIIVYHVVSSMASHLGCAPDNAFARWLRISQEISRKTRSRTRSSRFHMVGNAVYTVIDSGGRY